MTDMRSGGATPSIGDLVNSGIDYAKSAKAAIPYIAVAVVGAVAPLILGPGLGGLVGLICAIASIFLTLMASREAISGEFARRDSDTMAALKLLGVGVLVVLGLIVLSIPVASFIADSRTGLIIFSLIMMLIVVAVVARIVFLIPALALGDQSPFMAAIQTAMKQSEPYWTTLIALILVAALPGVLFTVLFGSLFMQLIGGLVSAAAGLVAIGAVSRFYAQKVKMT